MGVETTTVGERLDSARTLTRTNGHLYSRSRVGVSGRKVTKRKQQVWEILIRPTQQNC